MDILETPAENAAAISASTAAVVAPTYDAFISYSQHGDKAVAEALRSVTQTIGKPWWKVRSLNVFLDATSLSAAPGLWQSIADRLDRSRYLILLASPEAATSKWVDREVQHFIDRNGAGIDNLLIGLTGGELVWNAAESDFAWSDATPLPPCLRGRFREEPLWVDLRPFRSDPSRARKSDQAFLHAALDLAATIKGVEKADLYSDEVKRQRRSIRIAYGIATVIAGLAVGAGIAALAAIENANRANEQTKVAQRQTAVAEAQRKEAVHNESVGLAALSTVAAARGDSPRDALELVMAAWPRAGDPDRPELKRTVTSIADVLADYHEPTLTGHQADVTAAAFSPDGKRVVTASDDGTARIWDAATGAQLMVLEGHQSNVLSASFDSSGKRVLTASFDGTARIWDSTTGKELGPPLRHVDGGKVSSPKFAAFSPDGSRVATADDTDIWLWDLSKPGGAHRIFSGHTQRVRTVAFSPDGKHLLSASDDGTARVWDIEQGRVLQTLQLDARVNSAAYSPDGARIITACNDGSAAIWDAATGKSVLHIPVGSAVNEAIFTANGSRVITASLSGVAELWDAATGKEIGNIREPGSNAILERVAASPDGSRIVIVPLRGAASLWNAADWVQAPTLGRLDKGFADRRVQFSPDSKEIWAAAGGANIFDVASGTEIVAFPDARTAATAAFSHDGGHIVTGHDSEAVVRDLTTGHTPVTLIGHKGLILFSAFSPDDGRIVTASDDKTARIWDVTSGKPLRLLAGHEEAVNTARFSPDGARIVTASDDGTARLWDAASGKQLFVLKGQQGAVRSAAFSPDGTRILTRSVGKTVAVWDAVTGRRIASMKGHLATIYSAVFSSDGNQVLTASADRTARIWNASTGRQIVEIRGNQDEVQSAAFSSDGTRVVTASVDHSVRVWDAATGAQLAILMTKGFPVSVAISPDGSHIAIVSSDGVIQLWDVSRLEHGDAFAVACQRLGKDTDLAEVRSSYSLGTIAPICGDHAPFPVNQAALQ